MPSLVLALESMCCIAITGVGGEWPEIGQGHCCDMDVLSDTHRNKMFVPSQQLTCVNITTASLHGGEGIPEGSGPPFLMLQPYIAVPRLW